jgi:hypothetical protein
MCAYKAVLDLDLALGQMTCNALAPCASHRVVGNRRSIPVQVGLGSVLFWILLCHNPYLLEQWFWAFSPYCFHQDASR